MKAAQIPITDVRFRAIRTIVLTVLLTVSVAGCAPGLSTTVDVNGVAGDPELPALSGCPHDGRWGAAHYRAVS